ncbi:MAG: hypothetical protein IT379_38680, partial [Deltaproteobacteria bacterium]|nr:hypothetical protein [Deltaproteobacteria bacterium]
MVRLRSAPAFLERVTLTGARPAGALSALAPRAIAVVLASLVAVALAGCDEELTQIMLVVDTELDVPDEVDSVVIRVTGPSGREREASASLETTRPVTLALVPADVQAGGSVAIHVAMRREGDLVAERVATTSFVDGRVSQLGVCVDRACATSCPPLDAQGETLPSWSRSAAGSPCAPSGDAGVDAGDDGGMPPPAGTGHALVLRDIDGVGNRLHRVAIREGAELEDLSALLDMAIEPMEITDDRDASFSP